MCDYPTLNFQTCYPKHTYFYMALDGKQNQLLLM